MTLAKCYIRFKEDFPESEPQAIALLGFRERGVETVPFYGFDDINGLHDLSHNVGIAGFIGDIWAALDKLGITRPPSLDYPEPLQRFLGREIQQIPLYAVRRINHREIFVKPVK